MAARIARFASHPGGSAAVLVALCFMALLGATGFAVDLGHVYACSRQLQGSADLAAMAAAQAMADETAATPAQAQASAQSSAQATAALNPWPGGTIVAQATPGTYTADPALAPSARFSSGGDEPANAVQVTLRAQVPLYFAGLFTGQARASVARTAVAAETHLAAFSLGSSLASLNGGVANAVLSALTGSQVSLTAMNYQALAGAQVSLFDYLPALQTDAGLQAASFDQVLAAQTKPSIQLAALADALAKEGQTAAASAARVLASASAGLPATALSALIDLGPYGGQDHASSAAAMVSVNALAMVDVLLGAADGSRQLALSLDTVAPGLAALKGWLAIGQRPTGSPWLAIDSAGSITVRTAQMRLYLQASVAPGAAAGLSGGAMLSLPLYVEAAPAQASLATLQCGSDPSAGGFDLGVSPGLGTTAIGGLDPTTLNDFTHAESPSPATLLNAPLIKATAFSQATLGGGAAGVQDIHFSAADVAAHTVKMAATDNLAQATTASLLASSTFQVQVAGLGAGVGGAGALLSAALTPAAVALDSVVNQVEAAAGFQLGVAAVWPNGLRCNGAALVA